MEGIFSIKAEHDIAPPSPEKSAAWLHNGATITSAMSPTPVRSPSDSGVGLPIGAAPRCGEAHRRWWRRGPYPPPVNGSRFPKAYDDFSPAILFFNFVVYIFLRLFSVDVFPFPRKRLLKLLATTPHSPHLGDTSSAEHGFRLYINELADYTYLTAYGRLAFAKYITYALQGRRDFAEYLNENPRLCDVAIGTPFIITGMHRTGSTLLHRLMALDLKCRTTTAMDTFPVTGYPLVPPIRSQEEMLTHPRARHWREHLLPRWKRHAPEEVQMTLRNHPFDPFEPEEELILYQQCGIFTFQSVLLDKQLNRMIPKEERRARDEQLLPPRPLKDYTEWCLDEASQTSSPRLVKRYLQAFHDAWPAESHWCLKAPQHALFPEALYREFPDARYVITHRDPVDAVTSCARFVAEPLTAYVESGTLDLYGVGRNVLRQSALKARRLDALRARVRADVGPEAERAQFLDVDYDDIVNDPVGTVRRIYEHFGVPFSPEHEQAIKDFLARDKKNRTRLREGEGKKPLREPLNMQDFGFTAEEIMEQFPDCELGKVAVVVHGGRGRKADGAGSEGRNLLRAL